MTEAEWLASDDPDRMAARCEDTASLRKFLLFGYACCEQLRSRFTDPRSWAAVEMVRECAEGSVDLRALRQAIQVAEAAWTELCHTLFATARLHDAPANARWVSTATSQQAGATRATRTSALAARCLIDACGGTDTDVMLKRRVVTAVGYVRMGAKRSRSAQVPLVRDIFGNPFRRVAVDPRWLTSVVVVLARAIYGGQAFDRLPILADALQDAGCDDATILDHCRGTGPHVRGCWVVDLLLGKS